MGRSLQEGLRAALGGTGIEREYASWSRKLLDIRVPVKHRGLALSKPDYALMLAWASKPGTTAWAEQSRVDLSLVRQQIGDSDTARLVSARTAELVARMWYEGFSRTVRDVSVTQLTPGASAWRLYDLDVDGHAVDVKNTRQHSRRTGGYPEHLVAFKKQNRPFDNDICITGVVSSYLRCDDYARGMRGEAVVLGELRQCDISALLDYLTDRFHDVFDCPSLGVGRLAKPCLIPGWMFDYPAAQYCMRAEAMEAMERLFEESMKRKWMLGKHCACLSSRVDVVERYAESEADYAAGKELCLLSTTLEVNRRTLYYCLLGIALRAARQGNRAFHPSLFRPWIFRDGESDRPLGLLDPLCYLESLISTLEKLWDSNALGILRRYDMYRLAAPGVLRGVRKSGIEETVLAYCGGWNKNTAKRCGRSPLHLGMAEICSACGCLICPDCDFCSAGCTRSDHRL